MNGFASISEKDLVSDLVSACHSVTSKKDFRLNVYPRLMNIIPHEMFECGTLRMSDLRVHESMNLTFPQRYIQTLLGDDRSSSCPALRKWVQKRQPVLVDSTSTGLGECDQAWLRNSILHEVRNVAVHGVADIGHENACYFAFAGVSSWGKEDVDRFKFVVPHLHYALTQATDFGNKRPTEVLTQRELQVLQWISGGKSNTEIATILDISAWTVKIHVGNLLAKLNATNRSHAVAKAITFNLISV